MWICTAKPKWRPLKWGNASTKVWEFSTGLNEGKQLTDGLDIEFGPYYHHSATRNAELILDGKKFKMGGIKVSA